MAWGHFQRIGAGLWMEFKVYDQQSIWVALALLGNAIWIHRFWARNRDSETLGYPILSFWASSTTDMRAPNAVLLFQTFLLWLKSRILWCVSDCYKFWTFRKAASYWSSWELTLEYLNESFYSTPRLKLLFSTWCRNKLHGRYSREGRNPSCIGWISHDQVSNFAP